MKAAVYILTLVLLAAVSCAPSHEQATLATAEAVMQQRPDSALALLQTLDSRQLESDGDRALYALLLSQAYDKNYIDLTDDSLISIAVNHYAGTGDHRHAMLAHYYHGRIHYNAGDYTQAIVAYSRAEQLKDHVCDNKLNGLLYTQIGDVYRQCLDYNKSLDAYKSALKFYSKAGLESHKTYALFDISSIYRELSDYDLADKYIKQAIIDATATEDTVMFKIFLMEKFMQCCDTGNSDEATDLYKQISHGGVPASATNAFWVSVAENYEQTGMHCRADEYMLRAWQNSRSAVDSVILYIKSAHMLYGRMHYHQAYMNMLNGVLMQDSIIRVALQQPAITAQRDYFAHELEFSRYRQNSEKKILYLLIIIIVLIAASTTYYMIKRIREKENTISEYIAVIEELKSVAEKSVISAQLVNELFSEKYDLASDLGELIYCTKIGEALVAKQIYKRVKQFIDDLRNGKGYPELESCVNRYCENVMAVLRNEIPDLKETNYRQLCYHYAGFSVKIICIFMDETASNIYKRRSRLRDKIANANTSHKDILIRF